MTPLPHDETTLDIHHHIGPRGQLTGSDEPYDYRGAVEKHLRVMDAYGVAQACLVASHNGLLRSVADVRRLNEQVAEAQRSHPNRFPAAAGTVHPGIGEAALGEITYCVEELGMAALAWHTRFQGVFLDSPSMRRCVGHTAGLGVPVFLHMFAGSMSEAPWRLVRVAEEFPEARIVALDAFSSYDQAAWVVNVGGTIPNVTFDLSVMVSGSASVAGFVERFGPDRLVFGTNYYDEMATRVPVALYEVQASGVDAEAQRRILGGNARRILGLADPATS